MESPKSYQIDIMPRSDILNYKVSGCIRSEREFHQFIREVNLIIIQSGQKRILSDVRDLEGLRPNIVGAIKVIEEDFTPDLLGKRIAVIERAENSQNIKYRENVAMNRGYTLRYFTSQEEAETWLH